MDKYFLVLAVTVCLVLVLVYLYLFLLERDKSLALWGLSGALSVGEFLFDVTCKQLSQLDTSAYLQFIDWQLLFLSSLFLVWGTCLFTGKTLPRLWLYGLLGVTVLTFVNVICIKSAFLIVFADVYHISGMVYSGFLLLTYREIQGLSKFIAGGGMVLWGIQSIISCRWYGQIQPTFGSTADYLVATVLGVVSIIGLMLVYYQRRTHLDTENKKAVRYAAHELKNQAMTIRNYSQSILDGIYPKGTLEGSIHLINSEADRMGKQVRDLLYLDKLDYYLARGQAERQAVEISSLIRSTVERFSSRRTEINWKLKLIPVTITCDPEQVRVVLENLLDNQTRYAQTSIAISNYWREKNDRAVVRIWNDGPPIGQEQMKNLFIEYKTGQDGEFGLGLVIAKKIIESMQGSIRAENEEKGVAFYLEL